MSSLLLLKNRNECPKCRSKRTGYHNGQCANCGIPLFVTSISFDAYEADGNSREYYYFHPENGWMHRSQIMMKQQALSREIDLQIPERNTKTAEQKAAEIRKETQAKIKELTPSRKQVGYGKSITRL